MSELRNISVVAIGNPDGSSGVGEIVMYNSPQFNVKHDNQPGLNDNSYFFSIKIENNYTVYKLIKNNVRSNGAVRGGYLAIAFSIPRGYELVASNPYHVLIELWRTFKDACMTLRDKQVDAYEFNSKQVDKAVLDETASSFSLRPSRNAYRPMNKQGGIALVVQPEEKIQQLLSDVQYFEFSGFSEILVAETVANVDNYILLKDIAIPRPIEYKLVVDGIVVRDIKDRNESISIESKDNPNYFENVTHNFSVSELLDGNEISGITLDEAKEQISVSTKGWAKPKTEIYHVKIIPQADESYFYIHKDLIQISKNLQPLQLDDNFDFVLYGNEIGYVNKGLIVLKIADNKDYKLLRANIVGNEIQVEVARIQRHITTNRNIGHGNFPSVTKKVANEMGCIQVVLNLDKKIFKGNEHKKLKIRCDYGEKLIQSTLVSFTWPQAEKCYQGSLYLSDEWKNKSVKLSFVSQGYRFSTQSVALSSNRVKLYLDDFKLIRKNIKREYIIAALAILLFLVAFYLGFATHMFFNRPHQINANNVVMPVTVQTNDSTNKDKKLLAEDFFEKAKSEINKEDVTFDKIYSLYEEYKEFKDYDASDSVYNIIKTYHDLVALIRSGKIDSAKNVAKEIFISKKHADQVCKLNNANWKQVKSFDEIKRGNTASDSKPVRNSNGENKSGTTIKDTGKTKKLDSNTQR